MAAGVMTAGEASTRNPSLVSAARAVGYQQNNRSARAHAGRAAALLLASSLLLLGVASIFLAGDQGQATTLAGLKFSIPKPANAPLKSVSSTQLSNPRQEAAENLQAWSKEVDTMEDQVKEFQAKANSKAINELVHLERVKDLLEELKKQVPETPAPQPIHWGYGDGPNGPAHWGEINAKYETCATGKEQSPINFELNIKDAALPSLGWEFPASSGVSAVKGASSKLGREFYNGHTFEVEDVGGPTLLLDGTTYALQQFHMHTPSEHKVAGKHFDMEMHFVHSAEVDGQTKLAVVAVFFQTGDSTPSEIKKLLGTLPQVTDTPQAHVDDFEFKGLAQAVLVGSVPSKLEAADAFVPNFKNYFKYGGSFTTPPCTEGVTWVVFKNAVNIEAADLQAVQGLEGKNNRPVQPLNGREVLDVGGGL
eukprot:CAMPEP_0181325138 /NCGR_PEP_ID=MMETSP1101-20121128/20755_1 /TAXON_ID=46948 /ORGANISM="Rhodomonas abbreviata, Strain Caron Lab Isolate" /LENGTH=421 /DNA_ID=CAMNT_0023433405 /DNA_START=6 /DNA_END=1271 /DNA_ORIENTATION=-